MHEHIVRAGINYRFNSPGAGTATPLNALHAAPDNWAGAYVGGNLGYGIGHNPSRLGITDVLPLITAEAFTLSPAGVIGGAQAGYDWQAGHLVAGVEGDFQGASQKEFDLHARLALSGLTTSRRSRGSRGLGQFADVSVTPPALRCSMQLVATP